MNGGRRIKGQFNTGKCLVNGCPNTRRSNNLCNPHYLKFYFQNQPGNEYDRGRKWFRRDSLVYELQLITGMERREARRLVRIILNVVTDGIKSGKEVSIPGFGYFGIDRYSKSKYAPHAYFWPARELKTLVNKYYEGPIDANNK